MPAATETDKMAGKAPRTDLALVGVAGDIDVGVSTPLNPDEPLLLGRSAKGLRLNDPLVSVRHAEVRFDLARGYVIRDLDSVTGTFVDDEQVKGGERPIGIGTRLTLGETVFEVRRQARLPRGLRWVLLALAAVTVLAGLGYAVQGVGEPAPDTLYYRKAIQTPMGEVHHVAPDPRWLRERGLHTSDLKIKKKSDHDYNAVSELWLESDDDQYLVTFDAAGKWIGIGDLPKGCLARGETGADAFPLLDCEGTLWMMGDVEYELVQMDGVVVWYHEPVEAPEPSEDDGPLGGGAAALAQLPVKVARVTLRNPEKLSKFLAARNVTEPVHYVICEGAFRGIGAQALVASGAAQPLNHGCIQELRIEGPVLAGDPVAIALTARGHDALVADVSSFYAGHPDGLFLQPQHRGIIEELSATPGLLKGGAKLVADTREDAGLPYFNPAAPEAVYALPTHELEPEDRRTEAAPLAMTVNLINSGTTPEIETPGCARLVARVNDFRCYGLCTFMNRTFIEVSDVGCGPEPKTIISTGYGGGVYDAVVGDVQVRTVVESQLRGKGIEALRARITFRTAP